MKKLVFILAVAAVWASGCGEIYPRVALLAALPDGVKVVVNDRQADGTFVIYDSSLFAASGSPSPAYHGRVVAACSAALSAASATDGRRISRNLVLDASPAALTLVFADGAIFACVDRAPPIALVPPQNDLTLFAATVVANGDFYALAADAARQLALYRLRPAPEDATAPRWEKTALALPFFRPSPRLEMTTCDGKLLLAWRPGGGDKVLAGWQAAMLVDDAWEFLPAPPRNDQDGIFAVCPAGNGILLAQESDRKISLSQYENGRWTQLALAPFADAVYQTPPLALTLAAGADGLTVARSSWNGIHFIRAPKFPDDLGRVVATPLAGGAGDEWAWTRILLWGMCGVLLTMFLLRGWAMRHVEKRAASDAAGGNHEAAATLTALRLIRIGGLARLSDRTLAFAVDGGVCLAAPVGYLLTLGEITLAFSMPVFFIWLGANVVYSALAEMFWGTTPGKALFKMRVRALDGGKPYKRQILIRNLLRGVDFFPLSFGGLNLWYLVALVAVCVTRRTQRLGDLAAGTVVAYYLPYRRREIVLASQSPQRRDLLGLLLRHTDFAVAPANIDEKFDLKMSAAEIAMSLARAKTTRVAIDASRAALVIGADTVVAQDHEIFGKPRDADDARRMLRTLSGAKHLVNTAVVIIDKAQNREVSDFAMTEVHWRELTDADIENYIESGEWQDRAGGYAVQGAAGEFVTAIYGSVSNVIGLPLENVQEMLAALDNGEEK
ncbi:hypothetical protein AGMMS49959_11000 [Planctomycetales bacterium]|nr:hypothetical protein AGMMS49959_11000 [Planctomycetales bacterium]